MLSVTDPNGRTVRSGYESRVPRTPSEFVEYYNNSDVAQMNMDDVESYRNEYVDKPDLRASYKHSAKAEHASTAHRKSPFLISIPMQVRALMVRRAQILKGGIMNQIIQAA